ncbi:unnamed protein product, partial [Meganyctiphanes norvegica]
HFSGAVIADSTKQVTNIHYLTSHYGQNEDFGFSLFGVTGSCSRKCNFTIINNRERSISNYTYVNRRRISNYTYVNRRLINNYTYANDRERSIEKCLYLIYVNSSDLALSPTSMVVEVYNRITEKQISV